MTTKTIENATVAATMDLVVNESSTDYDVPLIRICAPADPTTTQAMRLVEDSGVLDFWAEDSEDGYSKDDGEAI